MLLKNYFFTNFKFFSNKIYIFSNLFLFYSIVFMEVKSMDYFCPTKNGKNPTKRLNELSSPGFPKKYPQNVDCIRIIDAPNEYDIIVRFRDIFQIESAYEFPYANEERISAYNCPHDFLEFRDGQFPFSPLLARLCGMRVPNFEILAKSGHLWVLFHSDALFEYRGFLADFEFVRKEMAIKSIIPPKDRRKECHFKLNGPLDGYIKSDEIAQLYKNKKIGKPTECVWQIEVPKWLQIAIFIEEFEMGTPNQCLENSLELYTGHFAAMPFRRFCGVTATHIYTGESLIYLRLYIQDKAHFFASRLSILYSTYLKLPNCSEFDLFDCGDEICIPQCSSTLSIFDIPFLALVCNGRTNCLYRRDEINCNWTFDLFGSVYRSGHLPPLILLSVLSFAVTALCLYYKPCKKRPYSFARDRNIFIKSRASSLVTENPVGQSQRPSRCSAEAGKSHRNLLNKLVAMSKSFDEEWSLSDLSLHEHHANCGQQNANNNANNGLIPNGEMAKRKGNERRATLVRQKMSEGEGGEQMMANLQKEKQQLDTADFQKPEMIRAI